MSIHIVLSPHMDDAVLSCGGLMMAKVAQGEPVRVVNVFAGIPDYTRLSPYAERQHNKWGRPTDPVGMRRLEDQAALAPLGVTVEYWPWYDAIYREVDSLFLYTDHDTTFGPVNPAEYPLVAALTQRLFALRDKAADTVYYAPLAVGGHVDHRLARDAALALAGQGAAVRFYEDFPYVARWGGLEEALAEVPVRWQPVWELIDVDAKIAAIARYPSQLFAIFGEDDWPSVVRSYAESIAPDGQDAWERLWRVADEGSA
ncbi:MAG: PIG-L family deacetylase [Anaerolineae bacterium]